VADSAMPNVKTASPATEKSVQQVAEAMDIEAPDDKYGFVFLGRSSVKWKCCILH